ncbi:hypothetical protein CHQ84_03845 [Francisella noatunensis subsp. orientalis]|uniref:DNA gyrase subunit B n=1 Tax=Francisella orientalis TaxID=299583 RepID=A0AAP7KJJ5_9GAMM|nr:hypothetical protein OOM_0673 [Francisella orientalis str. Toba 04]AHB98873.1 hypothetical protein M973_09010 [Francisella orientalis LADL 07-285A]AKN86165.1 hypothetical protein FNO12_1642 [Francisella orientalis FNO12]AKN87703.1 Hypothetical protein FNO24_1644 [Francisella orientalis FNO24]AKN89241.1 Hypothetical protein FNO190_1642 [Francisella orientalis]
MKSLFKFLILIIIILYPFIVYIGLNLLSIKYLGLIIVLIFILRLLILKKDPNITWKLITIVGILLAGIAIIVDNITVMLLYPVFVSISLFCIFCYSLFQDKSLITKLAIRISKEPPPDYAIKYTWYVTLAWCIFFAINACISVYTIILGSVQLWTLYNDFISYILIGLMMLSETIIRIVVRRYFEKHA